MAVNIKWLQKSSLIYSSTEQIRKTIKK